MLRRIRQATDAPIIVMKGAVAAERWSSSRLRPWTDMDIFVGDGEAVQAALLAAGFVEVGDVEDYRDSHHLRPVAHPLLPFAVEVHRRPKWPNQRPPSFDEVLEAAEPASFGVPGVFAPTPVHHAVLMAGHAWAHDPLGSIGPLADIAAMSHAAGPAATASVARAWGVRRLWASTSRAIDQLLLSDKSPTRSRVWHRHLYEVRPRTVFEGHVERLVAPIAAAPVAAAPLVAARAMWETLRPWPGERWASKLERSRQSLRHASMREPEHHEALSAHRPT